MNKLKKLFSFFVSLALLASMVPAAAFAQDNQIGEANSAAISTAESSENLSLPEDAVEAEGTSEICETSDSEERTISEDSVGQLSDVEYVYIESFELTRSATQNVVVSVRKNGWDLAEAELAITSLSQDPEIILEAAKIVDEAILFECDASRLSVGCYSVGYIRCLFQKEGLGTSWIKYDLSEDLSSGYEFNVIESGDSSVCDEGTTAYVLDSDGEMRAADSIGDAIDIAKSQDGVSTFGMAPYGNVTVVLDPGHGGHDGGASANGLVEKNLNLKIALACRDELSQYAGITTYMTRSDDTFVELADRVNYAKSKGASVLVSFHNDSAGSSAHGSSVIIPHYGEQHAIGDALGNRILAQLSYLGLSSRGTWSKLETDGTDWYAINRLSYDAGITGIIVEHAFLTNASNAAFLANDANLTMMGIADATTIAQHFGMSKISREAAEAFVNRLYHAALNRPADSGGFESNVNALLTGFPAAHMVNNFFISNEFVARGLSDEETIDCIYMAMMGRGADSGGMASCMSMLEVGMSITGVISQLSRSAEYFNMCTSGGLMPGIVFTTEPRDVNFGVTSFAHRLYTEVLGRDHDIPGLNANCQTLLNGVSAAGLAHAFFFSAEFHSKGLSSRGQVEAAYKAMLGRPSDSSGRDAWAQMLDVGMSLVPILSGFSQSAEFRSICASCGINPGYLAPSEPRDVNFGVTSFAHRLYTEVLGRDHDIPGLNANCQTLLNGVSAAGLAHAFFVSGEFSSKQLGSGEMVEIAYKTMLGRPADSSGKESWKYLMDAGMPVTLLVAGFSGSEEFKSLCRQYGMNSTPIAYDPRDIEKYSAGRIMGHTDAYIIDSMVRMFNSKHKTYPDVYASKGAPTIRDFCSQLYRQATAEGVRPEVLFCQAMKETGWLRFGGSVVPEQCNFGGLGATGATVGGAWFDSVEIGLLAQAQHLKLYASTDDCNVKPIVDQRWDAAVEKWGRGSAVSLQKLNGKWAVPGDGYGESILAMVEELLSI